MADILIVEDETEIADLVEIYLKSDTRTIHKCYNSLDALHYIEQNDISIAILDVMLPGMDGFALCRKIREKHTFPIIMLTARGEDADKINGMMIGADDYMAKPFNPLELLARVNAQLRRVQLCSSNKKDNIRNLIEINGLLLDPNAHTCVLYDQNVILTPTEFSILLLLCQNKGSVISSEQLFESVWGEKFLDSNNTVMVHIQKLRKKLGDTGRKSKIIHTVWGVGYKIE